MKKILLVFVIAFFVFAMDVQAKSKQDIIDYVQDNAQCGTDTAIFQSYNTTYTRLLKEKELNEDEIKDVLNYLETAYEIINENNVCSLSDADKLSSKEKDKLLTSLTDGAKIIHSAPSIVDDGAEKDKKKTSAPLVYDRDERVIHIVDNDILLDRIHLEEQKLTYTGPNIYLTYSLFAFAFSIVLALVYQKLARKRHRARFYKRVLRDLSWGLVFTTGVIFGLLLVFNNYVDTYARLRSMMGEVLYEQNNIAKEIILDEDNNIVVYPAYGNRYGELLIPDLGIAAPISFGDSPRLLENNIGHHTPSAFPGEGEDIIYSGHNSGEFLGNLVNLSVGEQIIVNASYGEFIYQVEKTQVVSDTDWHLLKGEDEETLILYTCYPFSSVIYGSRRYVVYAPLQEVNWQAGDYHE